MASLTQQQIASIQQGDWNALAVIIQNLATQLTSGINNSARPNQASAASAPGYPGTGVAYTNPGPYLQSVVISGGTVTVITLSAGGVTGETAGFFILRPGDSITCTSSVNPTVYNVTNLL